MLGGKQYWVPRNVIEARILQSTFYSNFSIFFNEAKSGQYSSTTLNFANSSLKSFVFKINGLVLWIIRILQYIACINGNSFETSFGDSRLSIFCIKCFNRLDSMLNLFQRRFFSLFFLLFKEFGFIKGNTKTLATISLQLNKHLLLGIHEFFFVLLSLSKS